MIGNADKAILGHALHGRVGRNHLKAPWQDALTVTPFMGVWVETTTSRMSQAGSDVTPFMGVWVETSQLLSPDHPQLESRPSWACG